MRADRRKSLLRVNELLQGAAPGNHLDGVAGARDERAFRRAATALLVATGAVIPIDWRSPPDEISQDLVPFLEPGEPIPEDTEATVCLELLAGRVPKRASWRLGWIDLSSDTYLVVRVADEAQLSKALAEAGLGQVRLWTPRSRPAKATSKPARALAPAAAAPTYKTWKDVVQGLGAWDDHGLLVRVAQDARARDVVRAHTRLARTSVASTLLSLLALLDGSDPTGALDAQLDAVRYLSFRPGSLERVLGLLADLAPRVTTTASLRRYLLATRLPAFVDTAGSAASRLAPHQLARIAGVVERGLKSKEVGMLCAAIDSIGRLRLSALQPHVAQHAKSPSPLVRQSATAARQALKRA